MEKGILYKKKTAPELNFARERIYFARKICSEYGIKLFFQANWKLVSYQSDLNAIL